MLLRAKLLNSDPANWLEVDDTDPEETKVILHVHSQTATRSYLDTIRALDS